LSAGSAVVWSASSSPGTFWAIALAAIALASFAYHDSLAYLVDVWINDENYNHGLFIPLVSLYLIWRERDRILASDRGRSWWGLGLVVVAALTYALGETATLHAIVHFSFWLLLVGFVVSLVGLQGTRVIAFPLLYLLTAVPLPGLVHQTLSGKLQLLSSTLGVSCLQLLGVMAFREGNVIDLGPIQLQVVEACSGIRFLFPLASLSLLCAYLYQERMWKRALVFLSSIPIAILLNGFRIGAIGVLVDAYGIAAAVGFAHFFEGWIFFVVSFALVFGEMWLLARLTPPECRKSWSELLAPAPRRAPATLPGSGGAGAARALRVSPQVFASLGVLAILAVASMLLVKLDEIVPSHRLLLDFPMQVGRWQGTPLSMERQYLDVLKLDDYLLADYVAGDAKPVNLYVGYYATQRKGRTPHSPAACIPGGGWEISSIETVEIRGASAGAPGFRVNRALIQKGSDKQVVFYWFKQRNRLLAEESLVKVYLFWDALTKRRSDGALVRLVAPVTAGDAEEAVDRRLFEFAGLVAPLLPHYVPD
jgi:exosortase D (VPLPA-CTERM-specific)